MGLFFAPPILTDNAEANAQSYHYMRDNYHFLQTAKFTGPINGAYSVGDSAIVYLGTDIMEGAGEAYMTYVDTVNDFSSSLSVNSVYSQLSTSNNNSTFSGLRVDSTYVSVVGTSGLFYLNPLTTAERTALSPAAGALIFNEDSSAVEIYNGSAWKVLRLYDTLAD